MKPVRDGGNREVMSRLREERKALQRADRKAAVSAWGCLLALPALHWALAMGIFGPKRWTIERAPNPNAMPRAGKGGWRDAKQVARNAAAQREESKAKAATRAAKQKAARERAAARKAARKVKAAKEAARRKAARR